MNGIQMSLKLVLWSRIFTQFWMKKFKDILKYTHPKVFSDQSSVHF